MKQARGWIVIGLLPALLEMPPRGVIAWAVSLLAGSLLGRGRVWRWVALGWMASVVVPGTSLLGIAASYSNNDWRDATKSAALGGILGLLILPGLVRQAGLLLLLASCALTVIERWER